MTLLELDAPFARDLGVTRQDATEEPMALALPFEERNTMYGHLHGGALAALIPISTFAVMRGEGPPAAGEAALATISLHLEYVRAARQGVIAHARVLRQARELTFFETRLVDATGQPIAFASSTISEVTAARPEASQAPPLAPLGDALPELTREIQRALADSPYLSRRGVALIAAAPSAVELALPLSSERGGSNVDAQGRIHEGAVLTLIDAAGATCPWTVAPEATSTGGATVALHAQFFGSLPAGAGSMLIASATLRARNGRLHWVDVAVRSADSGVVHAMGMVVFRFSGA